MRYRHVCIEKISCTLPNNIVTSEEIEQQLAPLYERLGLPEGRLELMTGLKNDDSLTLELCLAVSVAKRLLMQLKNQK